MNRRRALIVAGGMGARLRPATLAIPKPLLPLGGEAAIEVLIRQLTAITPCEIVVALGYLAKYVQSYLEHVASDACLRFVIEEAPLGTGGAVGCLPDDTDTALVSNADILTDLCFLDLLDAHESTGADLTVVGVRHSCHLPYGRLDSDSTGALLSWTEKPLVQTVVSAGIYVLNRRALQLVRPGERLDMPEVAARALACGLTVRIHQFAGAWFDLGDLDRYEQAARSYLSDRERYLPTAVWGR